MGHDNSLLAEVDEHSFAMLPNYLSLDECSAAIAEFESICLAHPQAVHHLDDDRLFGLERASGVARRFRDDPQWIHLAETYSGGPSASLFVMGNRIVPRGQIHGPGGGWHRDCFARQLKIIVYLTDVGPDNAPFEIIESSHKISAIYGDMRTGGLSAVQNRIDETQVSRILARSPSRLVSNTGSAGTAIIFDTSAIHRGAPIRSGCRLALTNYLCSAAELTESTLAHYAPLLPCVAA